MNEKSIISGMNNKQYQSLTHYCKTKKKKGKNVLRRKLIKLFDQWSFFSKWHVFFFFFKIFSISNIFVKDENLVKTNDEWDFSA